jgi:hypothetical protein
LDADTVEKEQPSRVDVEVYCGDISALYADIAVVGRYRGVEIRGPARAFDRKLNFWLSAAAQLGIVGSELGELFYVPIARPPTTNGATGTGDPPPQTFRWKNAPLAVLVAGLGEPGRFNREGLRFLMTNVTLAVVNLGCGKLSAPLLGFSRGEIPLESVLRGTLEGISDALARFEDKSYAGLVLRLIHPDKAIAQEMWLELRGIGQDGIHGLKLSVTDRRATEISSPEGQAGTGKKRPEKNAPRLSHVVAEPERTTRITITSASDSLGGLAGSGRKNWQRFQYSALAEAAVIPVREQLVQSYFVSQLPPRLASAAFPAQETYGKLLSSYLIPEDFRKLIESGDPLTFILDSTTALYPWEMAGFKGFRGTSFFGIDLKLTRQFRTLLSAAPGMAPPVDQNLRMLIIADPAPDLPCPGARSEAKAVLDTLKTARQHWDGRSTNKKLNLEVTLRIGPPGAPAADLAPFLNYDFLKNGGAKACDPVDLLALLINEHFDIVHYAGHGIFDQEGQRMGWVFSKENCILTAAEIFCVRQVPRLVFANACWSAAIGEEPDERDRQRHLQVGLAEAFFASGIQNYIGAGWPVDDAAAAKFAQCFYQRALAPSHTALQDRDKRLETATLGEALAEARRALFQHKSPTWGAYQHYGQCGTRLLSLDGEEEDH